jgi:hypothetical protein
MHLEVTRISRFVFFSHMPQNVTREMDLLSRSLGWVCKTTWPGIKYPNLSVMIVLQGLPQLNGPLSKFAESVTLGKQSLGIAAMAKL